MPPSSKRGDQLVGAVLVPVVVSEDGEDRDVEVRARLREPCALLRFAVRRQVTREQDEVDLPVQRGEGLRQLLSVGLAYVDVAGGGDAD